MRDGIVRVVLAASLCLFPAALQASSFGLGDIHLYGSSQSSAAYFSARGNGRHFNGHIVESFFGDFIPPGLAKAPDHANLGSSFLSDLIAGTPANVTNGGHDLAPEGSPQGALESPSDPVTSVPEPSTMALLGAGLAAFAVGRRRSPRA